MSIRATKTHEGGDSMAVADLATAAEIAKAVSSREVRAGEIIDAYLRRLEDGNAYINAVVTPTPDVAVADAQLIDRTLTRDAGESLPLSGVPFTAKDVLAVGGVRTTAGSLLFAEHVPTRDAPAVARLRRAGAVLVGKSNCPEFAMDMHTSNRVFGATRNPRALSRTSGGSSGGDSAAVASGFAAFGLGTDYGGSIRWPAHCTGLAAIRPTAGLVSAAGMLPSTSGYPGLAPNSMSMRGQLHTMAPIARSVRDLFPILRVLAGFDVADGRTAPIALSDPATADLRSLRCAWIDSEGNIPVRADVRGVVATAAAALTAAGAHVEQIAPAGLSDAFPIYGALRRADGLAEIAELSRGQEQLLTANTRKWLSEAQSVTVADFQRIAGRRDALRARLLEFMQQWPLWLMPVASIPAFRPGESATGPLPKSFDVDGVDVQRYDALACTGAITVLGFPAAVVTCGTSKDGLPVGVQVVGRPFADHEVLAVAAALEDRFGLWRRSPQPPLEHREDT
jgi:Asp-tRNA(Asn)/Glu-tRNA(Gln) amidotransferase A subunit family amidase